MVNMKNDVDKEMISKKVSKNKHYKDTANTTSHTATSESGCEDTVHDIRKKEARRPLRAKKSEFTPSSSSIYPQQ